MATTIPNQGAVGMSGIQMKGNGGRILSNQPFDLKE